MTVELSILNYGNLNDYLKYIEINGRKYFEGIPPQGMNELLGGDFNGDGLKDIKLTVFYMGSGLASLNMRIVYFFQKPGQMFIKVAFDDKQNGNRLERDINEDGNFEIITMTLANYESHNYWTFNAYNFVDDQLVCVNEKVNYPIMVQLLYRDNYEITKHLSRSKMKQFELKEPENLKIEK
jgi:hypothetical protein